MQKVKRKKVEELVVTKITCDCCGKSYKTKGINLLETQEFLSWEHSCGINSQFGDGNVLRLDLCQTCVDEVLGKYLKIEPGDPKRLTWLASQ